ncbi:hypothetical protein ETAA8_60990 [Anatilimnocola aggregata]|uniref:Uncharacterized protein n=1 Tax=Anatilimnocola aggregata TaxID=2528021 RepID=A0A517Y747_9BACT|nr:hypothetical protein [Anatilimnocola aggregata]QDU26057.1 hypothetical protein ETAA8_11290 [Anatilimnocola aggregata]QDU30946.1 hypothetical protein ETAA8_60990 [Anatilimnocola aggregata]
MKHTILFLTILGAAAFSGCCWDEFDRQASSHRGGHFGKAYGAPPHGPAFDRPFPIGQSTDSFWETQQTNAEAADFTFYDQEFRGDTAELGPGAKKHLESVALRLEHVPFPIVVEESRHNARPQLDEARRRTIVMHLNRMGITNADERVVVANAFAEGFTAIEAEDSYYSGILSGGFGGGAGRRFGGTGGMYR